MPTQNIVEYAKTLEGGVKRAFVELFAETSDFVAAMPFQNAPGGVYRYDLEAALPGVAFRGINESYTPTTGVINPQVEQTFIAGGDIRVDKALIRRFGPERRSREEKMQAKALTRKIADQFLNGSNATDIRSPDGLKARLTGSNVVANVATSGGAALSLYKLDRLGSSCQEQTHWLMSKAMRDRLTQAGRNTGVGGYVSQSKDDFGNTITSYRGYPILVGYEGEADGDMLPFTEVAAGGGAAQCTSIYALSLKEGMMSGIQVAPIDVQDLGEMHTSPQLVTRIEWDVSMVIEHPHAVKRLTSITDAAITA